MNRRKMLEDELRSKPGYIARPDQTDRQRRAIGFLAEHFQQAGRLFEQSDNKTKEMTKILKSHGYGAQEAAMIARHFDVTVAWLNGQSDAIRNMVETSIKTSVAEGGHSLPTIRPRR